MAQKVEEIVHTEVEGEAQFRSDHEQKGDNKEHQDRRVEGLTVPQQDSGRGHKHQGNDILAHPFEGGEPTGFKITIGKEIPPKDGQENPKGHERKTPHHPLGFDLSSKEERSDQKGEAMIVSCSDPQLSRQIRPVVSKDPHTFVRQGVKEIDPSDEKKPSADEEEVAVFVESSRIPDDDKNPKGHEDAEHLYEAVEKKVAVKARKIESHHTTHSHGQPWP